MRTRLWIIAMVIALAAPSGRSQSLLLISIDGLRPDYVTRADEHEMKLPFLREMLREGAHARGVRGVLPTSTYPNHTTILTGVSPAKHSIYSNKPFDPAFRNPDGWYWYSEDIKARTLWEAAAEKGFTVAAVSWPVSVGAPGVALNIPEYNGTKTENDLKMVRVLAGRPLMEELAKMAGPYIVDVEQTIPRDWVRAKYTVELIRRKNARFLTIHLTALDHLQHKFGPFTAPVKEALEELDAMVKEMADALREVDPDAVVCVVSDHGFAKVDRLVRIDATLVKAGLITLKTPVRETVAQTGVADWVAMTWSSGGSAAIVMKDPKDEAARGKVAAVLKELASDERNGIAGILDREAIAAQGAAPTAEFWVDLKPGYEVGTALSGPIAAAIAPKGVHGYLPSHDEMLSSFFIGGKGIRSGVDLGEIDMRSIAPTLANVLKVELPGTDKPALEVLKP